VDTSNIRIGTCQIFYEDDVAVEQDLGVTIGGVDVDVATSTRQTKVDQFGETVVEEVITGRSISVKVPMAETTLDMLTAIMPGATLVTDGIDPTMKKVEVKTAVGESMLAMARKLRLHPISKAAGDFSEDLYIPLAATPGGMQFAYKTDQERVFNAEFVGYPDANGLLFVYGDINATA
jgi:hypothetical protein